MVSPSGRARVAKTLAPFVDPPPGSFTTTTVGLPGRYFCKSGALNRAQVSDPPPGANGMMNSIVSSLKSASAAAP